MPDRLAVIAYSTKRMEFFDTIPISSNKPGIRNG